MSPKVDITRPPSHRHQSEEYKTKERKKKRRKKEEGRSYATASEKTWFGVHETQGEWEKENYGPEADETRDESDARSIGRVAKKKSGPNLEAEKKKLSKCEGRS